MAGVALLAGGELEVAVRLGLSMTALQCSIGAVNDLHDAPTDGGRRPPKPIPSGLVSRRMARIVAAGAAFAGVASAWSVAPAVAGLAVVVLAIGYAYDLVAKGTAWSWLPFALGVPLLPVYGWVGAVATLPAFFLALVPMAVLAGAALAIANAHADLERDHAADTDSIATRLGLESSWRLHVVLWLVVAAVGVAWLVAIEADLMAVASVIVASCILLSAAWVGRRADPARRERVWEIESIVVAIALAAWLSAVLA